MKKTWLIIGGVLALVLVVVVQLGPDGSIFSPGPIASKHHKDKDGNAIDCAGCHDGEGVHSKTQCLSCHEDKERTPADPYRESLCIDCHKEHQGDGALTAVPDEACWRCHKENKTHVTAPVMMAFGLSEDPRNCSECHADQHHRRHRQANVSQLDIADLRADLVSTHDPKGKGNLFHRSTCTWCHADMAVFTGRSGATRKGFSNPHVTHVGRLKIGCTWCHTSVAMNRTGFGPSIRKSVSTGACVQCHAGDYYGLDPTDGRKLVNDQKEMKRLRGREGTTKSPSGGK